MNIIILTELLPYPLDSGGAQAVFNMIDVLRKQHSITLVYPQTNINTKASEERLKELWPEVSFRCYAYWRNYLSPCFIADKAKGVLKRLLRVKKQNIFVSEVLRVQHLYFGWDFRRFIDKVIRETNAELVQVEFFGFLRTVEAITLPVKKLFIHHELRFVRNERILQDANLSPSQKKRKQEVENLEIACLNKFDAVVTLTDVDKKVLQDRGVTKPIFTSPAAINAELLPYKPWNGTVAYLGGHNHIPNKEGVDWFSEKVLPLLKESSLKDSPEKDCNLEGKINIIGQGWPEEYRKYGYNLCGFVPDLKDALAGSILIVPLLTGSGMRMKLLEAAAMSVPFVTTSVGVEGLDFRDNHDCLITDTPEGFAEALKRLTTDANLYRKIAEQAHETYKQLYSKEILAQKRDGIYHVVCSQNINSENKS